MVLGLRKALVPGVPTLGMTRRWTDFVSAMDSYSERSFTHGYTIAWPLTLARHLQT